ncbi:MAG: tyrosine-type recombinase/integrase [Acidobacteria bacterium]|nr:tyrosine-type recombinase/integrase [Acidobacteriota bacterium]MYA44765.1 tyrosine-type recombinase/integrase [Acidobacteriota bacterium]MYI40073.1 tyrosine-type recombinase/integrase [Acidobacteriota bacterium]
MERPYRLSARFVATIEQPGRYGDGRGSGGLSLLVKHTARGHLAKSWAQRINVDGRQRNLGLGSWPHVSLAEAREKCALNLAARRRGELVTGRKRTVPTFEQALEKVIAVHRVGWKDGGRQEELWRASLRDYAMPKLRGRPVDRITTADVMGILLPIWNEKRVTARRVRHRIGAVMRWAVAQGYREDNPAGEAIGAALPKNGFRPQHHRALPYADVGAAIETVRGSGAYPATKLAFEFLVLTACRSGEVRGARWQEIDLEGREWRIPAERMKTGREHRVPLSAGALAVLLAARGLTDGSGLVFPSARGGPLSEVAMPTMVRQLGIGAVPHGFRSSFRDWAAECSDAPREVCELALAHMNTNSIEAAYRRTDLFERRRGLMEQWAAFLAGSETSETRSSKAMRRRAARRPND